jgi:uncharacterized protein YbaR (Trm112 family)
MPQRQSPDNYPSKAPPTRSDARTNRGATPSRSLADEIPSDLIERLRCPDDHSPLAVASPEIVAELNDQIAAGRLENLSGERIEGPLDGGLIRASGDRLYPIVDWIPVLLPDEAIDLAAAGLTSGQANPRTPGTEHA